MNQYSSLQYVCSTVHTLVENPVSPIRTLPLDFSFQLNWAAIFSRKATQQELHTNFTLSYKKQTNKQTNKQTENNSTILLLQRHLVPPVDNRIIIMTLISKSVKPNLCAVESVDITKLRERRLILKHIS